VLEMSTDITEVKALQNQFKVSQERYHRLFEDVPCYISIQDRDMRITDCNGSSGAISARLRQEMLRDLQAPQRGMFPLHGAGYFSGWANSRA